MNMNSPTNEPLSNRQIRQKVFNDRKSIPRDTTYANPEYWYDWFRVIRKFIRKRILKQHLRNDVQIAKHYGCKFIADPTTGMGRELLVYEGYEYKQIRYMIRKIQSHKNQKANFFLDLGANTGTYGNIIASKNLADFTHMFEPNEDVTRVLFSNLMLNGLHKNKNIKHHLCAVGDRTHVNTFYAHTDYNDERNHLKTASNDYQINHDKAYETPTSSLDEMMSFKIRQIISAGGAKKGFGKKQRKKLKSIPVPVIALDDMFSHRNKFFAIKMDVEGNELLALQGMKNLVKNNDILLQVEVFPRNAQKVLAYISNELNLTIHKRYGSMGFSDYMCSNFLSDSTIDPNDIIYPPKIENGAC